LGFKINKMKTTNAILEQVKQETGLNIKIVLNLPTNEYFSCRQQKEFTNFNKDKNIDVWVSFIDTDTNKIVCCSRLTELPSCCAFLVSHNLFIYFDYRNKGLNKYFIQIREELARMFGYTAIICTDVEDNVPQRKTLKKAGWNDIYNVRNKRTGNSVFLSLKEL